MNKDERRRRSHLGGEMKIALAVFATTVSAGTAAALDALPLDLQRSLEFVAVVEAVTDKLDGELLTGIEYVSQGQYVARTELCRIEAAVSYQLNEQDPLTPPPLMVEVGEEDCATEGREK